MSNEQPKSQPKVGLLCEDASAVEVTDADGRQRIEKTPDRASSIRDMNERGGDRRPTHNVNG